MASNSADYRFHVGLLALLDTERLTERLTEYIGTLRNQTHQYELDEVDELAVRGELLCSAQEHLDIRNALLACDGAAVESLMHTRLRPSAASTASTASTGAC